MREARDTIRDLQKHRESAASAIIEREEVVVELSVARALLATQAPKLERQHQHILRARRDLRDAADVEASLRREIEALLSGSGDVGVDEW